MSVAALFEKQGRAPRSSGPAVSVRLPEPLLTRLAGYANDKQLTKSESMRMLIELGLDNAR